MRSLEVKFKSTEEGTEAFKVTVERQAPAGWIGGADSENYFAKDVSQTFLLEPGERIVIEPYGATVEMVYDKEQMAVMPRIAFESQPDAATKQKMEEERQQEVRDLQSGKIKVEKEAAKAGEAARDAAIQQQLAAQKEKQQPQLPPSQPPKAPSGGPVTPPPGKEVKKDG